MAKVQIFLSAVSAEFSSYRDALRRDLDDPNVAIKVQEDFIATGTETLDKLDEYIRQCDAVIHLVGDMTGALAGQPSVAVLRQRYPDLSERFPVLESFLEPTKGSSLPYTQWEAWLALYHRKMLIIATPKDDATRDDRYHFDQAQRADQQAHLARLANVERYPEIHFANADQLGIAVLRSNLHDRLVRDGRQAPTPEVFVCYARRDEVFVLNLAEALKGMGVKVWLDQWDIPDGADWDASIDSALDRCSCVLIVLSPAAVNSVEVRAEWRVALDKNKPVIPLLYTNCRIPRRLIVYQIIDVTGTESLNTKTIERIVKALQARNVIQSAPRE